MRSVDDIHNCVFIDALYFYDKIDVLRRYSVMMTGISVGREVSQTTS